MSTTAANQKACSVAPWGIEIDINTNSDLIVQSIPGCRLRGAIRSGRSFKGKDGDEFTPESYMVFAKFPAVPGMQLYVNPSICAYKIIDPLHTDTELCNRLKSKLVQNFLLDSRAELRGVPPKEGTLDKDRMKTLCREMVAFVRDNMAKVVKGAIPSMEDVEKLPGEFLLNPGSQVPNSQPRYEKDYENWVSRLNQTEQL